MTFAPPSLDILTAENILANGPVQQDQLPIDRQRSSDLRTSDPDFELLEELGIAGGNWRAEFTTFRLPQKLPPTRHIVVGNLPVGWLYWTPEAII
jgi:hypothetical protein